MNHANIQLIAWKQNRAVVNNSNKHNCFAYQQHNNTTQPSQAYMYVGSSSLTQDVIMDLDGTAA